MRDAPSRRSVARRARVCTLPLCFVTRNEGPRRERAAVAPRQSSIFGRTAAISANSHGRQSATSRAEGFL